MKRALVVLLPFLAIAAVLVLWGRGIRESLLAREEAAQQCAVKLERLYQRRCDLVPNLVASSRRLLPGEVAELEEISNAANRASSMTLTSGTLTPGEVNPYAVAQRGLTDALGRFFARIGTEGVSLQGTGVEELRDQIGILQGRIDTLAGQYDEAAEAYNKQLSSFPLSVVGGFFSLTPMGTMSQK